MPEALTTCERRMVEHCRSGGHYRTTPGLTTRGAARVRTSLVDKGIMEWICWTYELKKDT